MDVIIWRTIGSQIGATIQHSDVRTSSSTPNGDRVACTPIARPIGFEQNVQRAAAVIGVLVPKTSRAQQAIW